MLPMCSELREPDARPRLAARRWTCRGRRRSSRCADSSSRRCRARARSSSSDRSTMQHRLNAPPLSKIGVQCCRGSRFSTARRRPSRRSRRSSGSDRPRQSATRPVVSVGPSDCAAARPCKHVSGQARVDRACWPSVATREDHQRDGERRIDERFMWSPTSHSRGSSNPSRRVLVLTSVRLDVRPAYRRTVVLLRQRHHLERLRRADRRERLADELAERRRDSGPARRRARRRRGRRRPPP